MYNIIDFFFFSAKRKIIRREAATPTQLGQHKERSLPTCSLLILFYLLDESESHNSSLKIQTWVWSLWCHLIYGCESSTPKRIHGCFVYVSVQIV